MQKAIRVCERLQRAKELYESVTSGFQRAMDSHAVSNIMKIYFMVKISRETETAEAFFYLQEAAKLYKDTFTAGSRIQDEDPVGNIISLAQYMMEAKEPTRRVATTEEIMAKIIEGMPER